MQGDARLPIEKQAFGSCSPQRLNVFVKPQGEQRIQNGHKPRAATLCATIFVVLHLDAWVRPIQVDLVQLQAAQLAGTAPGEKRDNRHPIMSPF
jgi:hypothetical protein